MIKLFSDNKEIATNFVQFSDGAITYKVDTLPEKPRYISFDVCPTTPVYRIREELELLADAVLSNNEVSFHETERFLNLPYLPHGRADRRFEEGNPLPLLNFLSWLRDGDDCTWMIGERRCSCGNNRYYLEVEGNLLDGYYSYGQWH